MHHQPVVVSVGGIVKAGTAWNIIPGEVTLEGTERRGTGGRILGSAVGALVGVVAGAEIAVHGTHSEAAVVSTFTATAVVCTVAGYYAGRSADRHARLLRIAPTVGAGPR